MSLERRRNVHSDTVRIESSGWGIILETTEEVVVPNSVELGIALEGVHRTLSLDGVGALNVVVIGEKHLLGAVKLSPAANRLLRPIVPAHVHLHVGAAAVRLDPLDFRHVRRLPGIRRPHQHTVPSWSPQRQKEKNQNQNLQWIENSNLIFFLETTSDGLVDVLDSVRVECSSRSFWFGHGESFAEIFTNSSPKTKHREIWKNLEFGIFWIEIENNSEFN